MTIGKHQHLVSFSKVTEIYENDTDGWGDYRSLAMLVPAVSGHRARYHVYRLDFARGDLVMIGNELDLLTARAIARRSRNRDWEALTDAEISVGRWPIERWNRDGRSRGQTYNGPKARK